MTTDTQDLTTADLAAALRAQAAGYLTNEAAAELLIEQGRWLARRDFRAFIDYADGPDVTGGDQPLARVRWAEAVAALNAGELSRASGAAERTLRIAASLGGGVPADLREALPGLGRAHAGYVVRAITHATGG
ncbi:hypothetical protein MOQ72_42270 [Saccharopolyspora sp. K220]|uniref:hypothetical protein n=1 Tax=Saccharopolyspora soli TaxID=2926618 RepID=UPI001F5652A0|nr:hypothetical protein [Saccharopolyspora soli]MCI2424044.1 hypothetical protein [Saccharopolyspora soli]